MELCPLDLENFKTLDGFSSLFQSYWTFLIEIQGINTSQEYIGQIQILFPKKKNDRVMPHGQRISSHYLRNP